MAKPVKFSRPSKPKGGSTSFNFGANVKPRKARSGGGRARSGGGGGGGS